MGVNFISTPLYLFEQHFVDFIPFSACISLKCQVRDIMIIGYENMCL